MMKKSLLLLISTLLCQGLGAATFGEYVTEQDIQDQLSQTEILVKEGKATPEDLARMREEAQVALSKIANRKPNEQIEKFPEIRTNNGKIFRSVVVRLREPDGISIVHESGTAKIYYSELSQDMQKHFNYDADAAKAYQKRLSTQESQKALTEKEKKRQRAAAEEKARKEEAARQAKLREEARKKKEAELARLKEIEESKPEEEKPILDGKVIRNQPQPGFFYELPIPWQNLAFVKETGRKFYIPLKMKGKNTLRIRISGAADNSGDGGFRWEVRDYATSKKLDGGFTRETGVYEARVTNIQVTEVMLILYDDDTNFYDSLPGNGFSLELSY